MGKDKENSLELPLNAVGDCPAKNSLGAAGHYRNLFEYAPISSWGEDDSLADDRMYAMKRQHKPRYPRVSCEDQTQ